MSVTASATMTTGGGNLGAGIFSPAREGTPWSVVPRGSSGERPERLRQSASAAATYGFVSRSPVIPGAVRFRSASTARNAPVTPAAPSVCP